METQGITLTAISEQRLTQLESDIQQIKEAVYQSKKDSFLSQWLESDEARKQLNVSKKTWQNYRNKKVLPFSQFGRKIYVRRADLEAFMQSNLIH